MTPLIPSATPFVIAAEANLTADTSDRDRIAIAFQMLEARGFTAKMGVSDSCAKIYALYDIHPRLAYITVIGEEMAIKDGDLIQPLPFEWQGTEADALIICEALWAVGLDVDWEGTQEMCLTILPPVTCPGCGGTGGEVDEGGPESGPSFDACVNCGGRQRVAPWVAKQIQAELDTPSSLCPACCAPDGEATVNGSCDYCGGKSRVTYREAGRIWDQLADLPWPDPAAVAAR